MVFGKTKMVSGKTKMVFGKTKLVFGKTKLVSGKTKLVFGERKVIFSAFKHKMLFKRKKYHPTEQKLRNWNNKYLPYILWAILLGCAIGWLITYY